MLLHFQMAFFTKDDLALEIMSDGFATLQWSCEGINEVEMDYVAVEDLVNWCCRKLDKYEQPPPDDEIVEFDHDTETYKMFCRDLKFFQLYKDDILDVVEIPNVSSSSGFSGSDDCVFED